MSRGARRWVFLVLQQVEFRRVLRDIAREFAQISCRGNCRDQCGGHETAQERNRERERQPAGGFTARPRGKRQRNIEVDRQCGGLQRARMTRA